MAVSTKEGIMAEQQKNPNRDIERDKGGRQPSRQESGQRGGTGEGRTGGTGGTGSTPKQGQQKPEEFE
jgi:hypothetical protein